LSKSMKSTKFRSLLD